MQLYHLTVRRPDFVNAAVVCTFSESQTCLVLARESWLEVLRVGDDGLELVLRTPVFGTIRCLERVNVPGSDSDLVVVSSEAGELALLKFDSALNKLVLVSSQKTSIPGLRREIPGEYLAVDPKGRVVLSAAIEKLRSVCVLQDDGISPPVNAVLPSTFCYSVAALDTNFDSPAFACLERFRFSDKQLAVYEFNLGLNLISKSWSRKVSDECDVVVTSPQRIFIFTPSAVTLHDSASGEIVAETALTTAVLCAHLVSFSRNDFFVLAFTSKNEVITISKDLQISPVELDTPLSSLPVHITSKAGLIFLAASKGNHQLFQIAEKEPLKLEEVASLENSAPVTSSHMLKRQLLLGSSSSHITRLRPGVSTDELASTPLPAKPNAVFATNNLIVISFSNDTTTALAVGEEGAVEEVSEAETGIAANFQTLGISKLVVGLVQIHPQGLRHIRGTPPKVTPWLASSSIHVLAHACTKSQVALALSDNSVVYFEEKEGMLHESQHRLKLKGNATALCFSQAQNSEIRSTSLLVALSDETLRTYSVPNWTQTELHSLPEPASSVLHSSDFILVGHFNGTCSRIEKGEVSTRVFGSTPVQLVRLSQDSAIALSSRTWLLKSRKAVPLLGDSTQGLRACHPFITEDLPSGGLVGVKASSLEVFSLADDTSNIGLTPELVEADLTMTKSFLKSAKSNKTLALGTHSELIQIDNKLECVPVFETPDVGEKPVGFENVHFKGHEEDYLAVAYPSQIRLYQYSDSALEFVHATSLSMRCATLLAFEGRLLVAMENTLVLYALGKKQLLRQGGILLKDLTCIKVLQASGSKVFVGDSRRSVTLVEIADTQFTVAATDPVPRCVSSMILLDAQTVCIGDYYGNVAVLRTTEPASFELVAHFRVGDAITDLHLGTLSPVGSVEAIIYVGLHGTIGVFIPFAAKSEHEIVFDIERALKEAFPLSLLRCDPSTFINCYTPVRNVIDGDFCEYAANFDIDDLAESLETSPTGILNQLESLRLRSVTNTT